MGRQDSQLAKGHQVPMVISGRGLELVGPWDLSLPGWAPLQFVGHGMGSRLLGAEEGSVLEACVSSEQVRESVGGPTHRAGATTGELMPLVIRTLWKKRGKLVLPFTLFEQPQRHHYYYYQVVSGRMFLFNTFENIWFYFI